MWHLGPQQRVPAVSAHHRGQRADDVGHPPGDGQLRHSQDPVDQRLVRTAPELPRPLHAHLGILAQPGRTLGSPRSPSATSAVALTTRRASSKTPSNTTSRSTTTIPSRSSGPRAPMTSSRASRGCVCELLTHNTSSSFQSLRHGWPLFQ